MFFDVDNAVLAVAKSFGGVLSTQSLDECVSAAADLLRKLDHVDAFQYDVVRLHWVGPGERRTSQHSHNVTLTNKIQNITRKMAIANKTCVSCKKTRFY